ncbi:ribosome maturation factor RimP [Catellatospora tritici]|uniref:ribosome maturation factor RimP n=1 Tax=Catellatospora tritici TaxID=2851566 RepID=UPI001C2D9A93|nr:ribosome maturation factor RimP [Catellatospora tritici]MBV1848590.1 ribosome maturation factor RimP [Catellatospora tritici]
MAQRGRAAGRQAGRPASRPAAAPPSRTPVPELAARRTKLREVIEPVVAETGYDLEDLTLKQVGRRHLVQVVVDGDGGVGLDAIADVSRAVSRALDEAEEAGTDLIRGEYQLEVSSPGVDRPLTLPRHWARNTGRLVKVKVGDKTLTGRITEAGAGGVVLDVDGKVTEVAYDALGPGRVQVEFKRMNEISDEELAEFGDDEDDDESDLDADADDEAGPDDEGEER